MPDEKENKTSSMGTTISSYSNRTDAVLKMVELPKYLTADEMGTFQLKGKLQKMLPIKALKIISDGRLTSKSGVCLWASGTSIFL